MEVAQRYKEEVEEKQKRQATVVEERVEKHGEAVKDVTTVDHQFGDLVREGEREGVSLRERKREREC